MIVAYQYARLLLRSRSRVKNAFAKAVVAVTAAIALTGCAATLADRAIVPETLVASAEVDGMSGIRRWGDEAETSYKDFRQIEGPKLREKYLARRKQGLPLTSHMLALSGGGDNGAFGAGLLIGWTERGDRPVFDLVTGVSAGALIAPFAFLGKDYDRQLGELFTHYGADQIYQAQLLPGLLGGASSLASNEPLEQLIDHYVDIELMRRIAQERSRGRLLLVGTTNIDAERPVFWDLGKIAQIGNARALATLRKVLLASAAIPGIFPPVRIPVHAGGKTYEELHVDGGPTREVFFSPVDFSFRELDKAIGLKIERKLYVIMNGKVNPEWQPTPEGTIPLSQRSLMIVLKNQSIGDLIRMHSKARAEGIEFNLAVMPEEFKAPKSRPFDRRYMTALFHEGLRMGRGGYAWIKTPPGLLASRVN